MPISTVSFLAMTETLGFHQIHISQEGKKTFCNTSTRDGQTARSLFLERRVGNKGHELAIPFYIYHLRYFSLVFSSEQRIGSGVRCSNKERVKQEYTSSSVSPDKFHSIHRYVSETHRSVTALISCQNNFPA